VSTFFVVQCTVFVEDLHYLCEQILCNSSLIMIILYLFFSSSMFCLPQGCMSNISQMPVILIPIHFDRDALSHLPSCQRSVVIRTFITADFMTGVAAQPGKHLPVEVLLIENHFPVEALYTENVHLLLI